MKELAFPPRQPAGEGHESFSGLDGMSGHSLVSEKGCCSGYDLFLERERKRQLVGAHSTTIFSRDQWRAAARRQVLLGRERGIVRVLRAEPFLEGREDEEVLRALIVFDVVG